jgi:hypothetical protein
VSKAAERSKAITPTISPLAFAAAQPVSHVTSKTLKSMKSVDFELRQVLILTTTTLIFLE